MNKLLVFSTMFLLVAFDTIAKCIPIPLMRSTVSVVQCNLESFYGPQQPKIEGSDRYLSRESIRGVVANIEVLSSELGWLYKNREKYLSGNREPWKSGTYTRVYLDGVNMESCLADIGKTITILSADRCCDTGRRGMCIISVPIVAKPSEPFEWYPASPSTN